MFATENARLPSRGTDAFRDPFFPPASLPIGLSDYPKLSYCRFRLQVKGITSRLASGESKTFCVGLIVFPGSPAARLYWLHFILSVRNTPFYFVTFQRIDLLPAGALRIPVPAFARCRRRYLPLVLLTNGGH